MRVVCLGWRWWWDVGGAGVEGFENHPNSSQNDRKTVRNGVWGAILEVKGCILEPMKRCWGSLGGAWLQCRFLWADFSIQGSTLRALGVHLGALWLRWIPF